MRATLNGTKWRRRQLSEVNTACPLQVLLFKLLKCVSKKPKKEIHGRSSSPDIIHFTCPPLNKTIHRMVVQAMDSGGEGGVSMHSQPESW